MLTPETGTRSENKMNYYNVLFAQKHGECSDYFDALFAKATTASELPDGYKRVKSLTMDNDCYYEIEDFYLHGSDTLKFSCSITATCNVIGAYKSGGPNYSLYASTNNVSYLRFNNTNYNSMFETNKRYDIQITPTGSLGMKYPSTWSEQEFTTANPMCIGTTASAITTSAKMKGTFYGNIIVKDANGVRFKGVPCIRTADNTVGYYDTVSETFYEPIGTPPTYTE